MAKDVRDAALEMFMKSMEDGTSSPEATPGTAAPAEKPTGAPVLRLAPGQATDAAGSPDGQAIKLTPQAVKLQPAPSILQAQPVVLQPPVTVVAPVPEAEPEPDPELTPESAPEEVPPPAPAANMTSRKPGMKSVTQGRPVAQAIKAKPGTPVSGKAQARVTAAAPVVTPTPATAPAPAPVAPSPSAQASTPRTPAPFTTTGSYTRPAQAPDTRKSTSPLLLVAVALNAIILVFIVIALVLIVQAQGAAARQEKAITELRGKLKELADNVEETHQSARSKFGVLQEVGKPGLTGVFVNADNPRVYKSVELRPDKPEKGEK